MYDKPEYRIPLAKTPYQHLGEPKTEREEAGASASGSEKRRSEKKAEEQGAAKQEGKHKQGRARGGGQEQKDRAERPEVATGTKPPHVVPSPLHIQPS